MGIFSKLFKKKEIKKDEELQIYDKGLEKSRKEFTSKLNLLTLKHNKINEEYYEELEEILIGADIGVNTVMKFIDKIKSIHLDEKLEKTEADVMYENYLSNKSKLTKEENIDTLNAIKLKYEEEYHSKIISKKYFE